MIGRTLAVAVLLAVAWQLVRIAVKPVVWREAAAAPIVAAGVAVIGLGVGAIWVEAILRWPWVLSATAAAGAGGLVGAWWRARPEYGVRRGWPRGSLGIGISLDAIDDRTFYLDQARRYGPVFKTSQFGRPVAGVVGLGLARELLHGHAESLAGAPLGYSRLIPKGSLRYMTPDDHRREGAVFRAAFAAADLAAMEPAARFSCRRILAAWAAASGRHPDGAGSTEWLARWSIAALATIFFGLDPDDPRGAVIEAARNGLIIDRIGGWRWRRRVEAAFRSAEAAIGSLARERPATLAGPASIMAGLLAADPAAADDPTRTRNLFLAFRLATTDLAALLDWILAKLTESPEPVEAVRRASRTSGAPTGSQPADLASRVVLETLRMEQSEYLYRRLIRPVELAGARIPAGWLVRICVQESHRDPSIFPDPDRFDPDRFRHRTFSRGEYSPFGADNHGCLGAPMVLFLGRIFVEELCHGYQWRLVRDGSPERGTRHRHHWRPSSQRRFQLATLGGSTPT